MTPSKTKYFQGTIKLSNKRATRIIQLFYHVDDHYHEYPQSGPRYETLTELSYPVSAIIDWCDDHGSRPDPSKIKVPARIKARHPYLAVESLEKLLTGLRPVW